ncbi:hypothetical protein NI389_19220 (plasmid) [Pseudoalteromonas xiamenensis]|uniref:hypothetical protein n=1 Tax=Pseudoalteromonas xiamenensis TaxID=882626 RepID=UPI0027E4ED02|nr:hypothetical protein [Pseudoalteromonas xiamenensis]WMN61935.1 hypothetical protein NI389_19220 [Pseudoalteromonas xiamenensis]
MATNTNFNINVNDLISSIFGSDKERNDLAVGIQNQCGDSVKVNFYVDHGSLRDMDDGDKIAQGELWEVGVHAKGAGSNITMNITMPNGSGWAIMAATPVDKENYFKIATSETGYSSSKDAYKAASGKSKHYSGDGIYDETFNGYSAVVSMTGESPAACTIVLERASS